MSELATAFVAGGYPQQLTASPPPAAPTDRLPAPRSYALFLLHHLQREPSYRLYE